MILLKKWNEKMKKVLFFMFLLFLGLGAASVKAQVRIGGNATPNGGAMLDLNATDATNNGTKGLALPRVNLTSNTMQLTSGVVNLTGMLVYNTTATLGAVGIYFWNGASWVKASLPSTSAADSGKVLVSNGTYWFAGTPGAPIINDPDTLRIVPIPRPVTFSVIIDTMVITHVNLPYTSVLRIQTPGLIRGDLCTSSQYGNFGFLYQAGINQLYVREISGNPLPAGYTIGIRCYRATF